MIYADIPETQISATILQETLVPTTQAPTEDVSSLSSNDKSNIIPNTPPKKDISKKPSKQPAHNDDSSDDLPVGPKPTPSSMLQTKRRKHSG